MGIDGSVTHLLRRAGLGPTAAEAAAASAQGFGATVDALIAGLGAPDPGGDAVPLPTLGSPLTYQRRLRRARQRCV